MQTPFTEAENHYLLTIPKSEFKINNFRKLFPSCKEIDAAISSRRNTLRNAKRRRNNERTYDDHCCKRFIYRQMAKEVNIKSNVVTLLGPSGLQHAAFLKENILGENDFITSFEIDDNVYFNQLKDFKGEKKVLLHNLDVMEYGFGANYMDIDLKRSYEKEKHIIKSCFNMQEKVIGRKLFSATFSVNWMNDYAAITSIISCIDDLLGDSFVKYAEKKWKNKFNIYRGDEIKKITLFYIQSGKYEIFAFKYKDSSIMASINIICN